MGQPNSTPSETEGGDPLFNEDLNALFRLNEFGETVSFHSTAQGASPDAIVSANYEIPETIGRYEVREVMGRGGFGAVYRGYDPQLDRDVAIKIPLLKSTGDIAKQFLQEARQLAQITHPGIVTVFEVGIADDVCYIVSDFLKGQDLNHWLHENSPTWQESARLVAAVADGLAAAHSRNTIHRDVKPANIIVTEHAGGVVPVLVDFGLALSELTMDQPGLVSGTPDYMSPEQARGQGHRIDGRTDIYSLGVVLYRMICGRLPLQAPNVLELLKKVLSEEPQPPRQRVVSIPRELERICLKAMAKQITDRYTTAGDMAADLRRLLKQHEDEIRAAQTQVRIRDGSRPQGAMKILIADDHELSRFKLENDLKKWGHDVAVAEDGEEAWQLFQQDEFSIVITDWMMPRVDGLELVRRIRGSDQAEYVYIIMLTAKSEMQDIVSGMSAGADDFLTKPVHRDELQVRLRAGTRITRLNQSLNEANRRMRRSLEAAGQIQRSYLPSSKPQIAGCDIAWDHRPCVDLGGDMLNVIQLDDENLGLYVLDVNGEGVPAALLATNVCRAMSPPRDPASLLVEREGEKLRVRRPAEVAEGLNRQFAVQGEAKQYFTLVYGVLNLASREFRYINAGHPPVLHQHADASVAMLDAEGFPIGLASDTESFVEHSVILQTGDRLLMYSDGLPDTMNPDGEVFGAARLLEAAEKHYRLSLDDMIRSLMNELLTWRGESKLDDDVSILACAVV